MMSPSVSLLPSSFIKLSFLHVCRTECLFFFGFLSTLLNLNFTEEDEPAAVSFPCVVHSALSEQNQDVATVPPGIVSQITVGVLSSILHSWKNTPVKIWGIKYHHWKMAKKGKEKKRKCEKILLFHRIWHLWSVCMNSYHELQWWRNETNIEMSV